MALPSIVRTVYPWAATGDRTDPEDRHIDRSAGYAVGHEQPGSGLTVERPVMNQLLREVTGALVERLAYGILPWDADTTYTHHAFCMHGGTLYVTLQDSQGQTPGASPAYWREY